MSDQTTVLLRASYTQVAGSDPEYAQGAIEKNDLSHREVSHLVWLIEVEEPGLPHEWERRLNEAVDPGHGCFTVERATSAEQDRVRSGEITLQK